MIVLWLRCAVRLLRVVVSLLMVYRWVGRGALVRVVAILVLVYGCRGSTIAVLGLSIRLIGRRVGAL